MRGLRWGMVLAMAGVAACFGNRGGARPGEPDAATDR